MDQITLQYLPDRMRGRFTCTGGGGAIWPRLEVSALSQDAKVNIQGGILDLPWIAALDLVRNFAPLQATLNFRFVPVDDPTTARVKSFVAQMRELEAVKEHGVGGVLGQAPVECLNDELRRRGFDQRTLTPFQLRDLALLYNVSNGANFSVPGAGKTTVTLALNVLVRDSIPRMLVVCPKSAFPAWSSVVGECFSSPGVIGGYSETFTVLRGDESYIRSLMTSKLTRFVTNYETLLLNSELFAQFLSSGDVHLVLDESHRMKAGRDSQRGSLLLDLSPAAARRDILTGTPMPQSPHDIESQLDFLWPGAGLGSKVANGAPPRDVLSGIYARTMKSELGLKEPIRTFDRVPMADGQLALYGIVRDEFLREASKLASGRRNFDFAIAKRSVMRLLQISSNPEIALKAIIGEDQPINQGIVDQVLKEGYSTKMRRSAELVRDLAARGKKVVIWTIFTDTIQKLEALLADFNPVSLYGAVSTGDETDPDTREGRLRRFHKDERCMVMIANPAAAGEGISLHTVCHDAIYLDRSFVSTHFLQSIDRIHRLGLPPDVETNITILQTTAPAGLGSIDFSVNRRLAKKLRALQQLLDDPDLHELALDEEDAAEPIDFEIDVEDILDIIGELEGRNAAGEDEYDEIA